MRLKKNKSLHILIIHPGFGIRTIKQIEALINQTSYKISIIANFNNKNIKIPKSVIHKNINFIPFNFHNNFFHRMKFKQLLKKQFSNVDIIHCHNEPNYHIVDTIKIFSGKIPIIYDIHDLTSMRTNKKCGDEKFAYENSDMIIHVNNDFIKYGDKLYKKKPSHVILSTPSKNYFINKIKPIHKKYTYNFVYQGGIFDPTWNKKNKYNYRNYYPIFKSILDEGHHLHLFTKIELVKLPSYQKLNHNYNNFHFQGNFEYSKLIKKISNYDFGLAGFNFDNIRSKTTIKYLNLALGNKIFDYLSAGIPILTFNAKAMSDFVVSNNCGFEKISTNSWKETINKKIDENQIAKIANKFCMENQINELINIYEKLM